MTIGILGSGQLSRMLALAGLPLGFEFAFYDPNPSHCVTELGEFFQGQYTDFSALDVFLDKVEVITYENENIPLSTLKYIAKKGLKVDPNIEAIKVMQDRLLEKNFLTHLGIPTAPYRAVNNKKELNQSIQAFSLPVIIKRRTHSYDGKGQVVVKNAKDLAQINDDQLTQAIVEKFVDFEREVSLIGCRDRHGNEAFYDLCQNTHHQGILTHTNNVQHDPLYEQAKKSLTKIMDALNYVGVCTAEYFVCGDRLIVNELAPRVHNTGHWTIEGAVTSQFENHVRCIAGYPLGHPASVGNFSMYNILGDFPDKALLLAQQGLHVHDYKKAPKKNRKIGHVTFAQNPALKNRVVELLKTRSQSHQANN